MKNKLLLVIAALLATVSLMTSCSLFGDNDQDGDDILAYDKIIYVDEDLDLSNVLSGMRSIVGVGVKLQSASDAPETKGEVVFGDTARTITAKAKAKLAEELDKSSRYDIGYIIYAEGGSVAVYWQDPAMANSAVARFITVVINEKRLSFDDGILAYEYYLKRDFDAEKDWINISTQTTPDVIASLKRLNSYFDGDKLIEWMANLYDPDIGGFYYSRDARDYEPFKPDLESTDFILAAIVKNGAISDYNELPEEIRREILEFTWSTQSANDGYFYHPQWPQDKNQLNTDRYGRDISWATTIIRNLDLDTDGDGVLEDQYPLYCAPNGNKCALHNGTSETCSFPVATAYYTSAFSTNVTTTVTTEVSAAVSRLTSSTVKATAASYRPDYSSAANFEKWLLEYNADIKVNSGKAHNLAALIGEITNHGYAKIVYDHLYQVQKEVLEEQLKAGEEPTGLWQKTVDYNAVWGLLKYSGFYTNGNFGGPFYEECIPYAVKTCIKVIKMEADGNYHMNDLYNMWTGINNLINIVRLRNKNTEMLNTIYDLVRADATELIDCTIARLGAFKQEDGSFSYNSDGTTQPKVYGTNVCFGRKEGDVNAVHLACNMYCSIFNCLGLDLVPIFTHADGETFIDILLDSESINKKKQASEAIDYESQGYRTTISTSLRSSGAKVTDDADPVRAGNRVLNFKTAVGAGDYLYFHPTGYGDNCYLFETEMYVSSSSNNPTGQLYQISIGSLFMLELSLQGDKVIIEVDQDSFSGAGEEYIGSFSLDTWTTLRIECYNMSEENGLTVPHLKLWIDDIIAGDSTNYIGYGKSAPSDAGFTSVQFYTLVNASAECYFDNTYVSKETKVYDAYDDSIWDSRD